MPFSHGLAAPLPPPAISARHLVSSALFLAAALVLGACARQVQTPPPYAGAGEFAPLHYYPPPGPPGDPWGPYIREAAARYNVPEQWIRAVMQQESGGQEQAVSPVGAMGLMQVMPETYEGLRERYGLGSDPFDPHNNILAGAAYIREMYDRYGTPGFLAGYNAGPDRVDSYLAGASKLPHETKNYLAAVTPNLGGAVPLSGPFATYAYAGSRRGFAGGPSIASLAAGCDLNAAYDPNHPCSSLMRAASAPAPMQIAAQQTIGVGGCDLSTAYDPGHPCTSVGAAAPAASPAAVQLAAAAPPAPMSAPVQLAAAQPAIPQTLGAGGCDLDAAYDPSHPCTSAGSAVAAAAPPPPVQLAAAQPAAASAPVEIAAPPPAAATGGCDLGAAYDPSHPCTSAGRAVAAPAPPPPTYTPAPVQLAAAVPLSADADPPPARRQPAAFVGTGGGGAGGGGAHVLALPTHDWAIQVGAFANAGLARAVAEGARAQAPGQLRAAALSLPPTPSGRGVLYRARLGNLSASAAADACWQLNQRQLPCTVVEPRRS